MARWVSGLSTASPARIAAKETAPTASPVRAQVLRVVVHRAHLVRGHRRGPDDEVDVQ